MLTRSRLVPGAAALLFVMAGCLDLTVAPPQVGSVQGVVATRDDAPVAGLALTLTPESGAPREVTTGADGAFRLDGLAPGLWDLAGRRDGFIPLTRSFTVAAGQTRDLGTLSLFAETIDERAGTVTGTVHVASGPGEVQGATVEALLQPEMKLLATTAVGASGLFALQVPPGTFTLRVSHPYFVTAQKADVVVGSRAVVPLADDALVLQLNPGRVIGKVLKEVEGGAPVPAANVLISSDSGASATTAADGTFTLGGLPGGARVLRVVLADFHPTFDSVTVPVQPGADATLPDVQLFLDRGGAEGVVEMADGSPMRDATVFIDGTAYSAPVAALTSTPSRGSFRITGVPVGTYSLRAERSGYRTVNSGVFTITANRQTQVPALPRLTRVAGAFGIDDGDGTNTPGFTRVRDVQLVLNDLTGVAEWRAAETDPSIANLPFAPFGADGGTTIGFQLSSGDGEKTIFLQLKDGAGAVGPVVSASVVLDTTAPNGLSLRVGDGSGFIAQTDPLPFSLNGVDPGAAGATSGVAFMRLGLSLTAGNVTTARVAYQRDDVFTRGSSAQGPVTLYAQLIDNAGNVSVATSTTVVVDTLPPSGTLSVQQGPLATKAGYTTQPTVTLQVAVTAEPSGGQVRVRLGNSMGELASATPQPVSAAMTGFLDQAADGLKTVWFSFIDSAGNQSAPQSATITLDRQAPSPLSPSLVLVTLASPTTTNTLAGSYTATVRDDRELSPTEAVQVEIDGAPLTPTPPTSSTTVTGAVAFTLPGVDGLHTARVTFKDAAGNVVSSPVTTFTLDRLPPGGTFSLVGRSADGATVSSDVAGAVVSDPVVRIALVQEGASGVFASTSPIASCAAVPVGSFVAPGSASLSSFNLGVSSGTATVNLCLRDAAGNVAALPAASLVVDTQAPTGCALVLPGVGLNGVVPPAGSTATRAVNASLSGCIETPREVALVETGSPLTCSSTTLSWVPLSTLAGLQLGADGVHTFQACVRDAARNVANVTAASITLDTTPPTGVSVTINAGAAFINLSQVTAGLTTVSLSGLAFGATDWAVGISAAPSNFAAFTGATRSLSNVAVSDGVPLTVFARFRDAVGNVSDTSDGIDVDLVGPAAPTVTVRPTGGVAGFVNNEATSVGLVAPGATAVQLAQGADLTTCTAALGAASLQGVQTAYTVPLVGADGTYTVCALTRDVAGNPSMVGAQAVTLDRVPPATPRLLTASATIDPGTQVSMAPVTLHIANVVDPQHQAWAYVGGDHLVSAPVTPLAAVIKNGESALPIPVFGRNFGSEAGDANEFLITEVDKAGNVSAPGRVVMTLDYRRPLPVGLRQAWVSNGTTHASVGWTASPSSDVVAYKVYYAAATGDRTNPDNSYFGGYASQGPSPLTVTGTSISLSGLPQGATTYVTVVPVDKGGLVGTPPSDGGLAEVLLEPNEVPADLISASPLFPDAGNPDGGGQVLVGTPTLETSGDVVWAAGASSQGHLVLGSWTTALSPAVSRNAFGAAGVPTARQPLVVNDGNVLPYAATMRLEYPWLFTASGTHVRIWSIATGSPVLVSDLVTSANLTGLEVRGNNLFAVGLQAGLDVVQHFDVSALYDNVAGAPTMPSALKATVSTSASMPFQVLWSRDRLTSTLGSSLTSAYDLTNALDASAATNLSASDRFFFGVTAVPQRFQPVVSGDLCVVTNNGLATVASLPSLWAKSGTYFPEVSRTTFSAVGQGQLLGEQYFFGSNSSPSHFGAGDLSVPSAPRLTSDVRGTLPGAGSGVAIVGNYAFTGSDSSGGQSSVLHTWELSSPTSLRQRFSGQYAMGTPRVGPGFVVGASGQVFDFMGGPQPTRRLTPASATEACSFDGIVVDDTLISVRTADFRITRLDDSFNRASTPGTVTASSALFSPPVAERPTSIDRAGNYAVVAAVRNTVPTSLWLEVYRLSALRSQATNAARTLTAADKLGEFQFDTTGSAQANVTLRVRVTNGLAVVSRATGPFTTGEPTAWVIDVNPMLDDAPGTTMGANQVVGRLVPPAGSILQTFDGKLSNGTLYLAAQDLNGVSGNGLYTFNASAAYDGNVATKVGWGDLLVNPLISVLRPIALDVAGTTAVMIGQRGGEDVLLAFDVSTPDEPFLMGQAPTARTVASLSCTQHAGLTLAGTRVYVGTDARFDVFDLE